MAGADVTLDDLDARHHEVLAELRRRGPVEWSEAVGGWVVTGRELAVEVMRDPARFTVDDPRFSTAQVVGPSMLSLDGPEHERHRSPFAAAFRPGEVSRRYGDLVPRTARRLVTDLEPRGTAETGFQRTAGWTSAPIVRRTVQRIGPQLGIIPDTHRDVDVSELMPLLWAPKGGG